MLAQTHVKIENLSVRYNGTQALQNVELEIPRNQITVILGPSGCGKSTLLKSMNRFLELTEGTAIEGNVYVDGMDIYQADVDVTRVRNKVGLLAQRPYPLPMSIYDNVAFGLRIHGKDRNAKLDDLVQHYLELAGLWEEIKDRLHEPASGLSIGQQQRLCLARGLSVEPEIILGDEPTSALDPISARHIEKCLQNLKSQYTIILVTHILRQARRLADYVVFMYLGKLVEQGPAEQFFNHPREELTRAYLEGEI